MTIGFALEYSLGHTTHAQNLKRALAGAPEVRPLYVDLPYDGIPGGWTKLPVIRSNWSLRASLGAYRALRPIIDRLDAVLFHTQVTSLLSAGLMRRTPSVVSLDATPLQIDALGSAYGHRTGKPAVEQWKRRLNERAFAAARHLVTWSQWAKESLVRDYGVPGHRVTVIPPGVDTDAWDFSATRAVRPDSELHLLFVGGDFARKGGDTLLAALAGLPPRPKVRVSLVTRSVDGSAAEAVARQSGHRIRVYDALAPNSPQLRALFASADMFVFPTRGDCLPLAIMEAMAAGLPVITTNVAALPEAVCDGWNGLIVPPDDPCALCAAIETLTTDPERRRQMGDRARRAARERFDAATNYARLLTVLKEAAA